MRASAAAAAAAGAAGGSCILMNERPDDEEEEIKSRRVREREGERERESKDCGKRKKADWEAKYTVGASVAFLARFGMQIRLQICNQTRRPP